MNEWLNNRLGQLQKLGGQAYGAVKNKSPIAARGPKSALKTGLAEKVAGKTASKVGMKIGDWGPDQWGALAGVLEPLIGMLQKRRNR